MLDQLSKYNQGLLLKFPVYISLLAANADGKFDNYEKKSAATLSHIKTYSCDPILKEFYNLADKVFEKNIEEVIATLPEGVQARENAIKSALKEIERITQLLDHEYRSVLYKSMKSFKNHVSKAHHNILIDFVFPFYVKGVTY